jgi:hypothetical protein
MKKILTFSIILLFIGSSVVSSGSNYVKRSYRTSIFSPHDPIYINGNDDFTSENGITGGSGTSNDPYIIENWEIDASTQDGITIRNVSVYFTISNCYIEGGGMTYDGIVFINVTHGEIKESIIVRNRNGIMFRIQWPGRENSSNNYIHNNNLSNNREDGINFEHTVRGYHGNNFIYLNNIKGNNQGIYMIMSAYNHIFFNNILSNIEFGVNLSMCMGGGRHNKVYHNNFIDNGDDRGQACVWGTLDNYFDDGYPTGGNYWSDYNGIDNYSGPNQNIPGSDGICDNPYNITTYGEWENETDRYPLMEPWNGSYNRPYGPSKGLVGVEYTFCYDLPYNPEEESYIVMWYWGDGTTSEWLGPYEPGETASATHSWAEPGDYGIIVILRDVHGSTYWSEPWTITIVNMTKLDIGYISDGLFNIKAEIKNIGKYPALQVNWSITIRGRLGLIYKKWSGEIKVINPDKSEKVTTGFILGFGKYNITVTAEAFNAPKVSKSINGWIFFYFIFIRQ